MEQNESAPATKADLAIVEGCLRKDMNSLRTDMNVMGEALRTDMNAMGEALRTDMKAMETSLRKDIHGLETGLKDTNASLTRVISTVTITQAELR